MEVSMEKDSDHIPDQLVDQLVKGYDALNAEVRALNEQRREFENKLSWAKQQYLDVLKRFTPDSASQDFRTFLHELDEAGAVEQEGGVEWLQSLSKSPDERRRSRAYYIQHAADAREKIRYRRTSDNHEGVRIWNGKNAEPKDVIERDFTTPGTPGKLSCPFAAGSRNSPGKPPSTPGNRGVSTPRSSTSRGSYVGRRSKRASFHDPIRAEICGNDVVGSAAVSVDDSAPLCPIRFLDQHSPEEVAAYFEKHKHELPRSHEVCVRRYQSNEQQIRQLDAKYGSLVSMIQGLGLKHQPMLPEKELDDEAVVDDEPIPNDKIKKWAKAVSLEDTNEGTNGRAIQDHQQEKDRESRFDRPLKEVRLGESPSRPWGIQVPERYQKASSVTSAKSDPTASPLEHPGLPPAFPEPAKKCPIDQSKLKGFARSEREQNVEPEPAQKPPPQPTFINALADQGNEPSTRGTPSMVFNGPVFIGYSMEQAMGLLQQSGRGFQ